MSRLVADITPLRVSPAFRRLWFGLTIAQVGQQMTAVAVAIQVFAITGSTFAVGLIGLAAFVPLVVFGLYGGAIVDAHDRRTVALIASTGLWVCSLALLTQAVLGLDRVWLLYVIVGAQAGFFAVNNPARSAIMPRLIGAELLPAANALMTGSFSLGFSLGPVLAGLAISARGFTAAYAVEAVTFTAALYALLRLPSIPPDGDPRRAGLRSVLEGLRFLRTRPNVLMTFLVDLCAMVLAQPRALYPAIAGAWFGGGTRTVGLLATAPALGVLAAATVSGWLGRVRYQGRVVVLMVMAYGASVALFGFSGALWIGLLLLAASGAADMVSSAFRATILQVATPDELRGRLQGVFIVVVAGGPRLGDFVMGSAATLTSLHFAIVAGGISCVLAVAALAARHRGFVRYDSEHPVA